MQENINKKIIDRFDIVSFDIFDTLLLRPYVKPIDLFLHLEIISGMPAYAIARVKAENDARMKHRDCEEITLTQIYNEIDLKYRDLQREELDLEMQVLIPNRKLKKIYDYAIAKGKRIIIISDMYLPKDIIELILCKNGFVNYEKLYLSSEILKTKHTGSLFEHVKTELGLKNKNIIHIGDNGYSDIKMAKKHGFFAIQVVKPIDILLKNDVRAKILYEQKYDNLGVSILLGLLALNTDKEDHDYWRNFGYAYAGPILYTYVSWLIHQLKKDNINNVFCIARDGYSIKTVCELLNSYDNIKFHYVYAPRSVKLYCDLEYDKDNISQIIDLLEYYKDKDNYLSKHTPSNPTIEEGINFISLNIERYQRLAVFEKERIKKYLNSFCGNDSRIAVVDSISVNLSSQKLISSLLDDKEVIGYYWTKEKCKNDILESKYIYRSYKPLDASLVFNCNIVEFFMTAPEPPIKFINNKFNPIYVIPTADEIVRIDTYKELFKGIIDFVKTANLIISNKPHVIDYDIISDYLNILTSVSTPIDKKKFKIIKHAADLSHTEYDNLMRDWNKTTLIRRIYKKIIALKQRISNATNNIA